MTSDSFNSGSSRAADHPLLQLASDDLDFVVELVLKSGSLKDLAAAYRVSYPTIRARLDRLIERLSAAVSGRAPDPLSELLATLLERGELSPSSARAIRDVARSQAQASSRTPQQPGGVS